MPLAWWSGVGWGGLREDFFQIILYVVGVGLVGVGTRYMGRLNRRPPKKETRTETKVEGHTNLEEVGEGAIGGRVVEQGFQTGDERDFPGVERPERVGPDEPVRPDDGGLL